jgi:hypothetical protein
LETWNRDIFKVMYISNRLETLEIIIDDIFYEKGKILDRKVKLTSVGM